MVPETAKKWFPEMALGFSDPRVAVHITDGIKWVTDAEADTYDAIIVDSSDPVGPAEVLFQKVSLSTLPLMSCPPPPPSPHLSLCCTGTLLSVAGCACKWHGDEVGDLSNSRCF